MEPHPQAMLLTGCASGIGRHLTGVLAARGHAVLATDIDMVSLHGARAGWPDGVEIARLDVREPDDWDAAIARVAGRHGRLDVLINVAGVCHPNNLLDCTLDEIEHQLAVNTRGVILGTRAAASVMVRQGGGHIVHVHSLSGLCPTPGESLYTASKFAVRGFCLSVAQELRPHGVFVSLLGPDAVDTPMLRREVGRDEAALVFSGSRVLTVEQVAEAVVHRVLRRRPLEVLVTRWRGLLAHVASLFPELNLRLTPYFVRRGLENQRVLRKQWLETESRPTADAKVNHG